jgi:hypothetical protein
MRSVQRACVREGKVTARHGRATARMARSAGQGAPRWVCCVCLRARRHRSSGAPRWPIRGWAGPVLVMTTSGAAALIYEAHASASGDGAASKGATAAASNCRAKCAERLRGLAPMSLVDGAASRDLGGLRPGRLETSLACCRVGSLRKGCHRPDQNSRWPSTGHRRGASAQPFSCDFGVRRNSLSHRICS